MLSRLAARAVDLYQGGLRKLTIEEAWEWKQKGPDVIAARWRRMAALRRSTTLGVEQMERRQWSDPPESQGVQSQQRIFSYPQIVVGLLLGTPLAGAALAAVNAFCLGRVGHAWLTLALAVGYLALVLFAPTMGYGVGTALYIAASVAVLFLNRLALGARTHPRKSWVASMLITVTGLLSYVAMAIVLTSR
ncbi:hypothetical protein GCM10025759_24670 [Lysobacter panacisoli]|uniref:Uncharacterized protein n=1 Tax=Lysobacter panacisoli TaxID=1255263 RepID=A0ABP9LJ44_9GAMM